MRSALLPGVADRCLAAITRLVESRVRQSDKYRPWQPGADVGLDLDDPTFQPDQSHRPRTSEGCDELACGAEVILKACKRLDR